MMETWWWIPIGLVAWFAVAAAVALSLGPVLRSCSQAREALDQHSAEIPASPRSRHSNGGRPPSRLPSPGPDQPSKPGGQIDTTSSTWLGERLRWISAKWPGSIAACTSARQRRGPGWEASPGPGNRELISSGPRESLASHLAVFAAECGRLNAPSKRSRRTLQMLVS
jgi:hypothetical protein